MLDLSTLGFRPLEIFFFSILSNRLTMFDGRGALAFSFLLDPHRDSQLPSPIRAREFVIHAAVQPRFKHVAAEQMFLTDVRGQV